MPRPKKRRKVCQMPLSREFHPVGEGQDEPMIVLSVDEYETIRLIDKKGLSQEECAVCMQVARTTVQLIYNAARKKLADALVDGSPLRIEGGDYRVCDGRGARCLLGGCYKRSLATLYGKGDGVMRIALTYQDGQIFQHFGHTEAFKLYDVSDGKITSAQVVSTNGKGHGALADVLRALGADIVICGGIGGGAQTALADAGIRLYGGVSGSADAAAEALLAGQLMYDPNVKCSHHEHGEAHHCGEHGCGAQHRASHD